MIFKKPEAPTTDVTRVPLGATTEAASTSPETTPSDETRIPHSTQSRRPNPAESVRKAKAAFAKFSLSKFNGQAMHPNYVKAGQDPAATQKRVMVRHLRDLKKQDLSNRAITISLPSTEIKKLLPSLDGKSGTIDLDDLMNLVERNMSGTEFYAGGNPTLKRLSIQSQVEQIIRSVKGAKK